MHRDNGKTTEDHCPLGKWCANLHWRGVGPERYGQTVPQTSKRLPRIVGPHWILGLTAVFYACTSGTSDSANELTSPTPSVDTSTGQGTSTELDASVPERCEPPDPDACESRRNYPCDGGPTELYDRCLEAVRRYDALPFAAYISCLTAYSQQLGPCASLEEAQQECRYEAMAFDDCVSEEPFCRQERVARCYSEDEPKWCDDAVARFSSAYLESIDVNCYPADPGGACPRDYGVCVNEAKW